MALIGDPPVVFLDEPTSGVDPTTKRNLWRILAGKRRTGQAFVLTSHRWSIEDIIFILTCSEGSTSNMPFYPMVGCFSMDECEALCDRLTIVVNGEMKCIGDVEYLKTKYGQGYTVIVKLTEISDLNLSELETKVLAQYSPKIILKDKHIVGVSIIFFLYFAEHNTSFSIMSAGPSRFRVCCIITFPTVQ